MSYNTIKIKKHSDRIEEYPAHAAILPGSLVALNSDGAKGEVLVHATAGGNVLPMFAIEDELQGKGIDDAYATGDQVQVWIPGRGDVVLAILADGNSVEPGDFLESNGSGYLQSHSADEASILPNVQTNIIVGMVLENMDASSDSSGQDVGGGLGANKRIKVMIL
jgi:hypothetical protein